jgi:hypothetical protein
MNRLIIIAGLALVVPGILFAQINWTKHTIDADFDGAFSVYATDLDQDNDVDVVGAAYSASDIAWWENDDGDTTWTKHIIDEDFTGAYSVYAIDLDQDNDVDVLGAAMSIGDIAWWENDDGDTTWTKHTIDGDFAGAYSIYAIDLDGDDDVDVLGAAASADDITWWENDDGDTTWTKHTIDEDFNGARSVFAIDLDQDNDIDVLGAAASADDITWWENDDGDTTWTKHTIEADFDGAYSVYAINLDQDNDVDVLGTAYNADDIAWWENDDGDTTWTKHTIDEDFDGVQTVYAIDLDKDNDVDVLGAAYSANDIAWWENDDGGTTWTKHTIDEDFNGAVSVYAIDLDQDTNIDVLGAAFSADDIVWWENDPVTADVGPVSIDIPSTLPEDTTFNPQATVTNFGSDSSSFNVTCEIDPGEYTSIESVTDLAPDDSIQVTFPDEFTFVSGFYTVTVYTQLVDDINPVNDTLTKTIETISLDVSTISIDIPSTLPEDTTLNPKATITNFGSDSSSFDVTCEIDPGEYTSTETVVNLAPNDSIQVTFPDAFTFESGFYTVTVYTQLIGDDHPENDTLEKVIEATGIVEENIVTPTFFSFGLRNNPTKGQAIFNLTLSDDATISLSIYDVSGRLIDNLVSGRKSAGHYDIPWTSRSTAGVYFYKFESPWKTEVGKLVLVR